jgi:hypothetical protein
LLEEILAPKEACTDQELAEVILEASDLLIPQAKGKGKAKAVDLEQNSDVDGSTRHGRSKRKKQPPQWHKLYEIGTP